VAAASGSQFQANPLFLMPCAQKQFFSFLERQFPHLLEAYRKRYEKNPFLRGEYPKRLAELVRRLREKYKLQSPPRDYPPESAPAPLPAPQQGALFAA
jgi:hypothetical protein